MTNITELAQREKFEAWLSEKPLHARYMHWSNTLNAYDYTGIQLAWEAYQAGGTELVEALEKAQSANAAQDDHINQQQDRIEQLEKRNAELGKHVGMLEKRLKGTEESLIASTDMVTELESRTVTVKLPKDHVDDADLFGWGVVVVPLEALKGACADAGITVEITTAGNKCEGE
jgi:septal ring factor EnvC (AmiA/AmiB activator)